MKKSGLLYLLTAIILFSSMEVAIKATNEAFNPIQLNFLRFSIGSLVLLPMAMGQLKRSNYQLTKRDFVDFSLMGFCGIVVSLSFYTVSLLFAPAYIIAILFSGNTFIGILLARIFLKEKLSKQGMFGLFLAFLGMMIIINPLHFTGSVIGVVLCLISAATFALYGVFCKVLTRGKPTGGNVMTCFAFITGSMQLFILILISHIPSVSGFLESHALEVLSDIPLLQGLTLSNLALFLFIAIAVTGLGFAAYFLAIDTLSVAMASLVFFIKPVVAPIFAYIFLGEVISSQRVLGLSVMVLGSAILFIYNLRNIKAVPKGTSLQDVVAEDLISNKKMIQGNIRLNLEANRDYLRKKELERLERGKTKKE